MRRISNFLACCLLGCSAFARVQTIGDIGIGTVET
jgi:hypothetical protein